MENAACKQIRVLMLEDEATDAERAAHELRAAGIACLVERVETRQDFIDALEAFRPDIILADYKLPAFDGIAALGIAQYEHPEIPVIMFTGALTDIQAVELIHAGAKDYVLKDRIARLAPAVRRVLEAEKENRARRAAELALHENEERLNLIFNTLSEGVVMQMADGRTAFANASAEKMLGCTLKDMQRNIWGELPLRAVREDGTIFLCEDHPAMTVLKTGQSVRGTVMGIRHPDGKTAWLAVNGEPVFYPGEAKPYAAVITLAYITGRKEAETALAAAARKAS